MAGTFGRKPTDSHVVWTSRSGEGAGRKRYDFDYLRLWAAHFGIDYEKRTRVDHERANEPRKQHAVVFEWERLDGESVEMNGQSWDFGRQKTPRTFVEIDGSGVARLKSWQSEAVLDLRELWIDGPVLRMKTADRGDKTLDARTMLRSERPSSA